MSLRKALVSPARWSIKLSDQIILPKLRPPRFQRSDRADEARRVRVEAHARQKVGVLAGGPDLQDSEEGESRQQRQVGQCISVFSPLQIFWTTIVWILRTNALTSNVINIFPFAATNTCDSFQVCIWTEFPFSNLYMNDLVRKREAKCEVDRPISQT